MANINIEGSIKGKGVINADIIIEKKQKIAIELANSHSLVEPDINEIYYISSSNEADPTEPIKLLEISSTTIESGISPLYFTPSKDIPFPSVIVEISPNEFNKIKKQKRALLHDWQIGNRLFKKSI